MIPISGVSKRVAIIHQNYCRFNVLELPKILLLQSTDILLCLAKDQQSSIHFFIHLFCGYIVTVIVIRICSLAKIFSMHLLKMLFELKFLLYFL